MQIKGKYSWIKHIDFMVLDLLALFLAFVISYYLKFDSFRFTDSDTWMRYILIVSMLNLLVTFFSNPYSGILRRSYYVEFLMALKFTIYNFAFTTLILFSFKVGASYSREVTFIMYGVYFVFSLTLRFIWKRLLITGKVVMRTTRKIPVFVIGDKTTAYKIVRNIGTGDFNLYDIKGIHLLDDDQIQHIDCDEISIPVINDNYEDYILQHNIGDVLIAAAPERLDKELLKKLNANGIGINVILESVLGFQPEDQYIQNIGIYKAVSVSAFSFTPKQIFYLAIKRILDIFCGIIGAVVLIPITAIVKICYLISGDKSRIFYRQERVGQNGKIIKIWKYRSMIPNADEALNELLKDPKFKAEWDANQKFEDDPRITKVGHILRKTSIDELPQLLNVLVGDMSLVGPRPLVKGELEQHDGLKLYEKVRPGITGWWGCNGRSNIDYKERLELEYFYVKNCSLYLDLICIFKTAVAVLKKDGAI